MMGLVVTRRRRGFTLLEVLVAVAILGLALTIILSSQAGLFATAYRTQKLAYASNLVRCKMSEIEVDVVKEGFQLSDVSESGPCCIDDEAESGFSCEWKIQLVEMPTPSSFSEEEDAGISSDLDLGAGPAGSSDPLGGADPLGSLSEITSAASSGDREGAVASLMGASGGLDGMLGFAFSIAYPSFKPMLEASIRKVTVTVLWKQGEREKRLEVVQFITKPQLPPPELEVDEDGNPIGAGSSSPGGGAPPGNPLGGLLGGGAR